MRFDHLTTEQKAAAFDRLLSQCGKQRGELFDWSSRIVNPGAAPNEVQITRFPRYTFTIIGENLPTFADVLHHLATLKT